MATVLPPPSKRAKRDAQQAKEDVNIVPSDLPFVQVSFRAADTGTVTGGMHRIPGGSTVKQLELLINGLLGQTDEALPYAFSLAAGSDQKDAVAINSDIYTDIIKPKIRSTEDVLVIEYVPQAIFRVKAVSRCSATMPGHGGTILCSTFSPWSGSRLVTGSGDCTARLWDTDTGTPIKVLRGHDKWVLSVAWSPDGTVIATGSMDCTVRLWDAKTGKQLGRPLTGHSKWITALSFEPLHMIHGRSRGLRLASASKDTTVKIWDVSTRALLQTLSGHTASVTSARWGGLGALYTASQDKTVKIWNTLGDAAVLLKTLNVHAHWVNFIALSTDYLLRTGGFDPTARGRPLTSKMAIPSTEADLANLAKDAHARFMKGATTGGALVERVVTASDDMTMYLWNPFPSGKVNSDGSDVNIKPVARMVGHQKAINHVAFSADGRLLASAAFDNSVKIWDGSTGSFLSTLRGHVAAVYMCSWSADSRLLASCSKDCTVKVWDIRKGTLHADMPGHSDEVYAVEWSSDGSTVASGGKDKTIKLWKH
ncbi:WD40-repeat-containing domain protein [Dipodascopsis uninucleata]